MLFLGADLPAAECGHDKLWERQLKFENNYTSTLNEYYAKC